MYIGEGRWFRSACFKIVSDLVEEGRTADGAEPDGWEDLTLSMDQLVRLAVRWLPAITVGSFLPYVVLWGFPEVPDWPGLWSAAGRLVLWSLIALVVYAVSALLHEGLHLVAMILVGGVPFGTLEVGMRLSEGVLYVHTSSPMSARAYRIVLILPAVVLGLLPLAAGTVDRSGWMVVYGYVMLVSAIGDLVVLQLMRRVAPHTPVRDHPQKVGCRVKVRRPTS